MHTHFSVMSAAQAFLAVVIIGTAWRLIAYQLVASSSEPLQHVGKTMAFQF
jgi:hypothetical protein